MLETLTFEAECIFNSVKSWLLKVLRSSDITLLFAEFKNSLEMRSYYRYRLNFGFHANIGAKIGQD